MRTFRLVGIGIALMLMSLTIGSAPLGAAGNATATRTSGAGWSAVYQRTATGGYVNGPATPPAGTGSYHMTTGAGNGGPDLPEGGAGQGGKLWLSTQQFDGTLLANISALSYSTYVAASPSSAITVPSIQFEVDVDGNGTRDAAMVFEPYYSSLANGGTQPNVAQGTWQPWDAHAGKWWFNKAVGPYCAQSCFISFSDIVTTFPLAKILTWYNRPDGWGTQLDAGQNSPGAPWANFDGNVDKFSMTISGANTTTDFELGAGAATFHVSPSGSDSVCDGLTNAAITATPHCAFKTIQYAIGQSLDGDTVLVHTGTYNESPNVNKSIILRSPEGCTQTTIALQPQPPATTYLGSLEIAAPNVTIDGFTIKGFDGTAATLASSNIYLHSSLNNIAITNNCLKVGAINDTSSNGDDGMGILTSYTVKPAELVNNVTVTGNIFTPVNTEGGRAFYVNPGVNIFSFQNNQITGNFTGTALTQAKSATVANNTITGAGAAGSRSAGIGTWGAPDPTVWGHATFQNNTISGTRRGIVVYTAQNVTLTQNSFDHNGDAAWIGLADPADAQPDASTIGGSCNKFTASDSHGVNNTLTGTINAPRNWWGSPTGPTHPTNVGGTGDAVTDRVTFSPWSGDAGCTVSYGIPTKLVFTTQPGNGTPGAALATQPAVSAQDAAGNLGINFAGPVALALGANPGTATLGGTTPVNAVNGVATFSGISVSAAGTGYTLVASSSGLTSATSSPFDVTPLVPTIISLDVTSGPPAGGTTVVITGTNFVAGDTVTFGGVAATNIQVLSSTQISVKTPAHVSATVNVQVLNTNNQGGTLTNGYTYTVAVGALSGVNIAGPSGSGGSPTIKVGQVAQFTARGNYTDGSTQDVTNQSQWSSDSPNVAKVDQTGKVTGIAPGPATITASFGGQIQTIVVNVSPVVFTGVQPAPAPQSRPSGASVTTPGPFIPAPVAAPTGR